MQSLSFILIGLNTLCRQLRLSVSSVDFYKDVYRNYQGYGIKYLFIVSFIASIILCICTLNYIENIKYVTNQLPDIQYNNSKIFLEEEKPLYLYSKNKDVIAAIDINNQLTVTERSKIPVILTEDQLILNLVEGVSKKKLTNYIKYSKIFTGQKALSPEMVKKYCAYIVSKMPSLLIYIGMPFFIVLWFIKCLFEISFIILLVYVITNLFGPKSLMKNCMRLVIFASGVPLLLQPIIILFYPAFGQMVFLLQMFTVGLLFTALWQIKNKEIYKNY
ncbi:DUF1189 family protein [Rickettsia endosymbiont of Halotydeus destructor]|uniref:DUF1189 family protein n=1 Tax=Rickettsia endosymbiont of Halotydeus destructor TaxID=2996754 RepID=UPI003BB1EA7C